MNRRLTALEVSLRRGTEMAHVGKVLQRERRKLRRVLTMHHRLLEDIRQAGLLGDLGSRDAVACLHAYNEVMK